MNGSPGTRSSSLKHTSVDFSGGADQEIDPLGVAPETEKVREAASSLVFRRGTDYDMDYPQGHIVRLPSSGIGAGDTVRIDYVPISVTRLGPPKDVRILNSARPSTPEIVYAVPWFEWETSHSPSTVKSNRRGQGIRVYLERPWWSSGAEERLGVVMYAGAPPTPVKPVRHAVGLRPRVRVGTRRRRPPGSPTSRSRRGPARGSRWTSCGDRTALRSTSSPSPDTTSSSIRIGSSGSRT